MTEPAPSGVVVTQPEDLPPHERISYERHDRVPSDDTFRLLEVEAARLLEVTTDQLVLRRAAVTENGSVMLMEQYDRPFGTVEWHVLVQYRGGESGLTLARYPSEKRAIFMYEHVTAGGGSD